MSKKSTNAAKRREFLDRLEVELSDDTLENAYKYARKRCEMLRTISSSTVVRTDVGTDVGTAPKTKPPGV